MTNFQLGSQRVVRGLVGKGEIVEGEEEGKLNKTFDLKILF